MNGLAVDRVASKILGAVARPNPVLFAGAGVGRRVDLQDWHEYMEWLANACERFGDVTAAKLIRERAQRRAFTAAATVFKTCETIPEGERWKILAEPFLGKLPAEKIDRLTPLVKLPFTSIVTTNYDHALHNASVKHRGWFMPVERGDGSLKGATLRREFFIARIHGRADLPLSMVVDVQDYVEVERDSLYMDFLMDLLKSRSCLFVGFSFLDPAITHVLRIYEAKFGPTFEALHSALVPAGADDLVTRLRALNIEPIQYDSKDHHVELWKAIRLASDESSRTTEPKKVMATPPRATASIHRFMAFSYAQLHASPRRQSVASIVQDGIVLSVLAEREDGQVTESVLADGVRLHLRVSIEEAARIVADSVDRLVARGQVRREAEHLSRLAPAPSVLETHLTDLAENVIDRIRVREQFRATEGDKAAAKSVLEAVFVSRAWDLAAHYAGVAAGVGADLPGVVHRLVEEHHRSAIASRKRAMELAILDLLTLPEERETPMLAALGRAAFGLQLILATPRQALFQKFALPQRIYLDANVLMPAITDGHPLRSVYVESLTRLSEAAQQYGSPVEVIVGEQFLNEIVSHRRIGREIVADLGLEQPRALTKHILLYTATNTNVFIGAYASRVRSGQPLLPFSSFLQEVAPYETEEQLARHLKTLRIEAAEMRFISTHHGEFTEIFSRLREGYEAIADFGGREKESILIQHEAQQLTQLRIDEERGLRSIFVTADRQLRRVLQQDVRLHGLAGTTVSHIGLVALVDVMVGIEADTRSVARLMWATPFVGEEEAVFDYFVRLGLREYEEGMAMEMQAAARRIAAEAAAAMKEEGISLFKREPKDVSATARFLDQYEDRFFENWRDAIEKRERKGKA